MKRSWHPVLQIKFNPAFSKVPPDSLSGNFWISFSVKNETSEKTSVRLYFVSDRLSLYLTEGSHIKKKMQGGLMLPYGQWPSMNCIPEVYDPNSYPFDIAPHTTVYFFARSEPMAVSSVEFNGVYLFSEKAYLTGSGKDQATIGAVQLFFTGMTIMMVLFSLFIFVINRDQAYLFFTACMPVA